MSRNIPNASDMGKVGGKRNIELHGKERMSQIAAKGRRTVERTDPDFYRRLAQAGYHARQVKIQARIASEIGDTTLETFAKILLGG